VGSYLRITRVRKRPLLRDEDPPKLYEPYQPIFRVCVVNRRADETSGLTDLATLLAYPTSACSPLRVRL